MSMSISSSSSSTLFSSSPKISFIRSVKSQSNLIFNIKRSFPKICATSNNASSSIDTGLSSELDAVSSFSEIVPDTVIFDDFERFPPTAATVSSSLLLGICSLPDTKFRNAVETALADSECYGLENGNDRMSCFFNKALVNVGADLMTMVPGRVSVEVDARLAYDTKGIVRKGIEACSLLEAEGIQIHLTFVYSFCQAAAAAQAGASVIQIFVGRIRDWARTHSGDPEVAAAIERGEDPGLALVTKAYNYIHKCGHKSKLMAAAVRNKQDLFSLLGVDYVIAPLKILQSLKDTLAYPDEKYSYVRRLSPASAKAFNFSDYEMVRWDQRSLAAAMGPCAEELLGVGLEGYSDQTRRVEELFGKIWPPPNV